MKEHEVWGLLSKGQFLRFKTIFIKGYGNPIKHRRLAMSFWNPKIRKNTDTRIRITDGKPQIIQKTGRWENTDEWKFKETLLDLPTDSKQIFAAYNILKNIAGTKKPIRFIQHRSFIFNSPTFEIKLAEQFGKTTKYIFEVELKKDNLSLQNVLKELDLSDKVLRTDTDFWDKWNKEVNLTSGELGDEEILDLIESYL